jgi:hypothetical protein
MAVIVRSEIHDVGSHIHPVALDTAHGAVDTQIHQHNHPDSYSPKNHPHHLESQQAAQTHNLQQHLFPTRRAAGVSLLPAGRWNVET